MTTIAKGLQYAWQTRRAWWFTATSRSRERFARTAIGSFWLGLSNLLSITVLAAVYGTVFKVEDFKSYVVYLGIGLVTWNTIAAAVLAAPNLFRANSGNIKNSNIHPLFYSLEEWAFQVQTFAQSFGLVVLAMVVAQPSILLHLFSASLLPLFNLLIFIYWFPLLICLLGAEYDDLFQFIPIILQLMFLLSPILYKKEALGALGWTADFNPLYRVLSNLRHAMINGDLRLEQAALILLLNILGTACSFVVLERKRRHLPFLV
jgi:lipopolysaccharide transport system permease protein